MNIPKLFAPDFTLGKVIVLRKTIADSLKLIVRQPTRKSLRLMLLMLQVKPQFTMATNKSLTNLYDLVHKVNRENLPGDIVECGVWNGGSAAVMAIACRESQPPLPNRKIWLFDSFQGLPPPGENDDQLERDSYFEGWNKGSVTKVRRIFSKLKLPLDSVYIIPGWFNETLKTASVSSIALLNIDADWYDSVKLVLETFYDKVVPGGYIALDDYGWWLGCDRAVADFFTERQINGVMIQRLDQRGGAYFQKPL
jgi:O-methyltransferase